MKSTTLKAVIFVFCFALILTRAWLVPMTDDSGRGFMRGDGFSDINTYSAVRHFVDFGFWSSKLRPMHGYNGNPQETSQVIPYTHYPALPDVTIGLWAKATHSVNEPILRIFPILMSVGLFFLIYYFLGILIPDPRAAFISASILVLSNYFLAWSDVLHKHTFEEVFKWSFVFLLYWYYQHKKPVWMLFLLGLFAVLIANASFEPITFIAVTVVGFSWIYEKNPIRKVFSETTIFLGLSFIAGFVLHMYLNTLYFDSFELALKDMRDTLSFRTNNCADQRVCGLTWKEYLQFPLVALNRIERYYLIPGFAFLWLGYLALKKFKQERYETYQIAIVLGLASFSWYLVMRQHAWVHHFVGKQSGMFYGLLIGTGLLEYIKIFKADRAAGKTGKMIFHYIFIFYMVGMALTQQVGELYWKNGFGYWVK